MVFISAALCFGSSPYSPEDVPDVHKADGSLYVSDPGNILSPETVARINGIAASLQDKTGIEMAVAVVPSISPYTPEDFSERLFRRWGIGQEGEDNGLLILLVTDDRYIRFETGYGLEGTLTDALSKRIQATYMNPHFSKGDWDEGISAGVKAVSGLLLDPDNSMLKDNGTNGIPQPAANTFLLFLLMMAVAMFAISIFAFLMYKRGRKCPRCGTRMETMDEASQSISPGIRLITTTYKCPKCGYILKKNRTQNIGASMAGGLGGGLGIPGRGFGGGPSGGRPGGWGGGRSGGGGATSKF